MEDVSLRSLALTAVGYACKGGVAALAGKMLAGTTIYGVVLIPTTAPLMYCAAGVVVALMVEKLVREVFINVFKKAIPNAPLESLAFYLSVLFYSTRQASVIIGVHPAGFVAITVLGVATTEGLKYIFVALVRRRSSEREVFDFRQPLDDRLIGARPGVRRTYGPPSETTGYEAL